MKALVTAAICLSARAWADPLVLRANALATTAAPAGLVTVTADGDLGSGLTAEAVVWTGATLVGDDNTHADVLVLALRARSASTRACSIACATAR